MDADSFLIVSILKVHFINSNGFQGLTIKNATLTIMKYCFSNSMQLVLFFFYLNSYLPI